MRFNVAGLMISDISFLIVAHFWERLPGTYWWFSIGPIVEGLVGGLFYIHSWWHTSSANANAIGISVASIVMHAYISDCSDPTAR